MAAATAQDVGTPDGSIQADIESALFGGPIAQTAPELAAATSGSLADSAQLGGIDYSFYTSPETQGISSGGFTDLSAGDPTQDFSNQLPTLDLTQFDASDSGGYVNPDGSISMP